MSSGWAWGSIRGKVARKGFSVDGMDILCVSLGMQLILSGWGNSLGLRIPKSIARLLGIGKGAKLVMELEEGKLILSPLVKPVSFKKLAERINLKSLVAKVCPDNRPESADFEDPPLGQEIW